MILKVKKFQLPCLDLISSPSPSMKIQIAWGIGIQKWLKTKTCWNLNPRFSVIFPPIIWIYMEGEGDEIKLKQVSKRDRTLLHLNAIIRSCWIYKRNSYDFLFKLFFLYLLLFPFHISRLTWLLDCGNFFCTVWCVLKKELDMCHFLECVAAIFLHAWASSPPAAWKWKDSMYALKRLGLWSFLVC